MKSLLSLLLPLCLLGGCVATFVPTDPGAASTMTFYMENEDNTTELHVGKTVHLLLYLHFPLGDTVKTVVELFTPDNETTLMVVCDPKVTAVGSNLAGVTTSFVPTLDAKDSTTNYDRAVLDFGTVTNSGTDVSTYTPSMLLVEWDVTMISTPRTDVDGNVFWASAGAEYDNETNIWVGQSSFALNTSDYNTTESVSVNMTGPDTIEVGTSASYSLDVYLPDDTSDVIVDVIIPTNGIGILSVCSIALTGLGNSYKCFGKDALTHTVTASSSGRGNERAQLVTGTMTNAYAREITPFADSVVTFQFMVYLYENSSIGDVYQLGATVRIGTDAIWAGSFNMTTAANTTSANMTATPTFSLTNVGASSLAVGQGTTLRLDINPPADVEGDYIMEILMPVNDTARMDVCTAKVTYIGLNMACVIESEPVFSSRVGVNSTHDKVYWNLGRIKNHGYRTDSNSILIRIEISIRLLNHSLNVDGVQLWVSIGIQFSVSRIWVGQSIIYVLGGDGATSEQPTFTLAHAFGNGVVQVGASTYITMEMTVPPGAAYSPMDVEFLMPTYQNDTALFSLCRVELYYVGSNMPCLNQATANASITYITGVDGKNYRGVVSLGSLNNVAVNGTAVTSADVIRFGLVVKVEDHVSLQTDSTDWVAAGIMWLATRFWVGQLQMTVKRDALLADIPQNGTMYAELEDSALVVNQGGSIYSNMYIKVPPQSTFRVSVAVSACSDISICALYVAEAGTNLPCVASPLPGNVTWDTTKTRGESALLHMEYVTNVHVTETIETNATFDNNTIRVSLAGRVLTTATIGSCAVTWTLTIDGVDTTYPLTVDVQAAATSVNVSATLPAFSYYMAALEENATEPTGDLYPGQCVLLRLDITPNNYVSNELTVKFMTPSNSSQPMEVCAANLVHAGANIPCLQRGAITGAMSSRNNDGVNDVATLELGSVCSYPLKSDNLSQVVTVEAVVCLRRGAAVGAGDFFWPSVTVNIDGNVIYVGQLLMTVVASFTEEFFNASDLAVPPSISLDGLPIGAISMSPGDYYDIPLVLTFPPNKTILAAADVSLPFNESACFTVVSVNVTGVGANLGCGASTFNNVTYTSTNSTSQNDGAYLDMGVVTNSGHTYRTESAEDSDNQLNITYRIQMADCVLSDHQAELWPSFAAKVGSMIGVIDKAVSVQRTGLEAPDLLLTSSIDNPQQTYLNGQTIEAGGCLKHSETSNAEGRNVKVNYYLPPYLTFGGLTSSNGTTPTVVPLSEATGVSLTWDDVFFTDHLCFNFTLGVDLTGGVANPPSGPAPRATSPFQSSATMRDRATSSYSSGALFYSVMNYLPVNVTGGCSKGCSSTVTLIKEGLNDCQVSSSSPRATVSDLNTNTASYWTPVVRCKGYPVFLQVNFGNLTRVTKVSVVQDTASGYSFIDQYRLKYKKHEDIWTDGELVTGVTALHNHVLTCPLEARQLRLEMVSVASARERLGLRVEVEGCTTSSDTAADFCTGTDSCRPTIPSSEVQPELMVRTFLVIPGDVAFVCDINPFKTSWMYPDGEYVCLKTQGCTSNQWTTLDSTVMNILGYDSKDTALYGIARGKRNYVMSLDGAATWYSIPASRYTLAKAEATFTAAKEVQLSPEVGFTVSSFGAWNVKFDGLYCNTNTKILDWCFV